MRPQCEILDRRGAVCYARCVTVARRTVARKTPEEKQAWRDASAAARAEVTAARKAYARSVAATKPVDPNAAGPAANPKTRGRPSTYTPAIGQQICERLSDGELVSDICESLGLTRWTVTQWCDRHPEFGSAYVRAREAQADACFEFALKAGRIATPADAQAQRLRHDAEKWAAAKLRPRAYSDKHQHEVSGPDGAPIQTQAVTIDPSSLTAEQRAVLRTALTAMRPPSERGGA